MIMLCLDTYALIELHNDSPNYRFIANEKFIMTEITLAEFFRQMLKEHGLETADYWLKKLEPYSATTGLNTLRKAQIFREENKKINISFFDAQGYIFALENDYKFVTGDKEFKGMKGVLFVK